MRTHKKQMKWLGLVVFLGSFGPVTWSRTWTVGKPDTPCPNANYTAIGDAISQASAGDVIQVCPALYPEQLLITKPLTLRGIGQQGVGRVLIQPTQMSIVGGLSFTAVISILNTSNVTIQNLSIDASNNAISGCTVALAGIHFYNASGMVDSVAVSGTQLSNPASCTTLFPGNGFGVQIDQDATSSASYHVTVQNSSIHDFSRNAILAAGVGETVDIDSNSITGVGPSLGVNQFGVFLANGATGRITNNNITQGSCAAIPIPACFNLRSEGVVLRSSGDGVIIDGNTISNVQAGVFVNGASRASITRNTIVNVDALSGIHIQGSVSGLYIGNRIVHVGPFTLDTSTDEEGCGINDVSASGSSGNTILANTVNDAYCGVGYVTGDRVEANVFWNTLYETLNGDSYPDVFPPPVEPGQPAPAADLRQSMTHPLRTVRQ